MRHSLSQSVDNIIGIVLLFFAALTPLLFFNLTTEFYDMPKFLFLLIGTAILYGLWILSWIVRGKITIQRTPLDIPLLALIGSVIISTLFSSSRLISIYGNFPAVHGSAASWVIYVLIYFVTVSNLKNAAGVKRFLYVLFASAAIVSIITLLSFFGIYLPLDFAQAANFTPTGSTFSTIAFLILLFPIPLLSILNQNKFFPLYQSLFFTLLLGITIILVGSIPIYIVLLIIFAVCLLISKPSQIIRGLPVFLLVSFALICVLALAYLPLSWGIGTIQQLESNFPKEVQLPFAISWKITASTLRDVPFVGSGPATYLFDFTSYKPIEFNLLAFWNFPFSTAYNEFLGTLSTLGILGFIALAAVCLAILNMCWKNLSPEAKDSEQDDLLPKALALASLVSVVLLAIHAATLVSTIITIFILAAFMASQKSVMHGATEISLGHAAKNEKQFDLLPMIILILFLIAAVPALFASFKVAAADYYHRKALKEANSNGTLTYEYLQKAEGLAPQIDLYRVDMEQTNFALANAIAAKAAPAGGKAGTLSDQDKKTIQTLLTQAITEGRVSVSLSPRSPRNWEVLASIYRNITGVAQNALAFSLDAYGRAIQRDPFNPALRVSVGSIYYSAKNYDLAVRFFTDAANLKLDYVNAYYNLAVALRDKGDLQNAAAAAQQTVLLLAKNPKSADYKTASDLLLDIKSRIAKGGSQTSTSGQGSARGSALQNSNISGVNVSNLNNPPEISTPSAIKQNPVAPHIK